VVRLLVEAIVREVVADVKDVAIDLLVGVVNLANL